MRPATANVERVLAAGEAECDRCVGLAFIGWDPPQDLGGEGLLRDESSQKP